MESLLADSMSDHQLNIKIGEIMKRQFPEPLISFPDIEPRKIAKSLVATCTTAEEIEIVLTKAGFYDVVADIMTESENKEAFQFCQAFSEIKTRDGSPCTLYFSTSDPLAELM